MRYSLIAPPAIGDAVQCWPLLDDAAQRGFLVFASSPVKLWIAHYLNWEPKDLKSIPDKIDGGPIIDFHGDDEVLALIAKTSSTEVIGFAKAKEYTQQLPFLGSSESLYEWYRRFWHSYGAILPERFPFLNERNQPSTAKSALIVPHSGSENKNWPVKHYLELACSLRKIGFTVSWLLPHESTAYDIPSYQIPKGIEAVQTQTWRDTFNLIDSSFFIVTNDSSPMHIAAAQEKRVVGIFTRSAKSIWFPYDSMKVTAMGSGNFERPEGKWMPTVNEVLDRIQTICDRP